MSCTNSWRLIQAINNSSPFIYGCLSIKFVSLLQYRLNTFCQAYLQHSNIHVHFGSSKRSPYINQAHQQAFSSNGSTQLLQTKTSFSTADSSKKYSSAKQFFNEMSLWTNDLKHHIAQKVPLSCPINDAINECKELYVPIQVFAHDPCPKDVPNSWPDSAQLKYIRVLNMSSTIQNLSSQPKDCP